MIDRLDHANLRTAQLDVMVDWYGSFLQLKPGARPDFRFPGAWLYAGDQALVHLVGVATPPPRSDDLALEHVAFSAHDFRSFVERLQAAGEKYRLVPVPDAGVVQVNVWDPDGNHLHIDFDASEVDESDLEQLKS